MLLLRCVSQIWYLRLFDSKLPPSECIKYVSLHSPQCSFVCTFYLLFSATPFQSILSSLMSSELYIIKALSKRWPSFWSLLSAWKILFYCCFYNLCCPVRHATRNWENKRGNKTVFVKRKTRRWDQRPKIWPMFRVSVSCSQVFENRSADWQKDLKWWSMGVSVCECVCWGGEDCLWGQIGMQQRNITESYRNLESKYSQLNIGSYICGFPIASPQRVGGRDNFFEQFKQQNWSIFLKAKRSNASEVDLLRHHGTCVGGSCAR